MHDPSKAIFNFSKHDCEKNLLAKGLNFILPPKYLDCADYSVNFELFYRNICNLGILSNEDLDFVKKGQKKQPSLLIETMIAMYCNIFLKKSLFVYKIYVKIIVLLSINLMGNSVVVVDKVDYLDKMENLLNDTGKCQK